MACNAFYHQSDEFRKRIVKGFPAGFWRNAFELKRLRANIRLIQFAKLFIRLASNISLANISSTCFILELFFLIVCLKLYYLILLLFF